MTRALATFALLLGLTAFTPACDDDDTSAEGDMSFTPADTTLSNCFLLSQCIYSCNDDAGTSCRDACLNRTTPAAKDAFDALALCIEDACTGLCADPTSLDCMRCRSNAEFTDPASCPAVAVGCGACFEKAQVCTKPPL